MEELIIVPLQVETSNGPVSLGTLEIVAKDNDGIVAGFITKDSITACAQALQAHHFNWYQVITHDEYPPSCISSVPYIDPPCGGFPSKSNSCLQWADDLIWYWDERKPSNKNQKGYDPTLSLKDNIIDDKTLLYFDQPTLTTNRKTGKPNQLHGKTWLVALDKDSNLKEWIIGFHWETFLQGAQKDNQRYRLKRIIREPPSDRLYTDLIKNFKHHSDVHRHLKKNKKHRQFKK